MDTTLLLLGLVPADCFYSQGRMTRLCGVIKMPLATRGINAAELNLFPRVQRGLNIMTHSHKLYGRCECPPPLSV